MPELDIARGFIPDTAPFQLQATTPVGGFALVNGTPDILVWTAPNDGKLHRALVLAQLQVTVNETGGQVNIVGATPVINAAVLFANGSVVGGYSGQAGGYIVVTLQPGQTIRVAQAIALTAGAAVLFGEIWGS